MCHFLTSRCSSFPPKSYCLNVIFGLNIAGIFLREEGKSELYHVQFLESILTNLQRGLNADSSASLRAELHDSLRELSAAQTLTSSIHPRSCAKAAPGRPCSPSLTGALRRSQHFGSSSVGFA